MKEDFQTVEDILQQFGADALEPTYFQEDDGEIVTIPHIRNKLSAEEWVRIPLPIRNFIVTTFYTHIIS